MRRRRECPECKMRFSTTELVQLKMPMVVKTSGEREPFSEEKLRQGMTQALSNRPVSTEDVEAALAHIIKAMRSFGEGEIPTRRIGEWVMEELKQLDQVAYVRYASVYLRFEDVSEFRKEIERLESELDLGRNTLQMSLLKRG